jgi:hypothetical protein
MATGGAGAVFLSTRGQPHLLVAPRRGGGLRWLSDLPF